MPSSKDGRALRIAIAIMAAGKGTRLKSKHPKVLHEVGGKPILSHVIATAAKVVPAKDIFVIIGHEADRVRAGVASRGVDIVWPAAQRGHGPALTAAHLEYSLTDMAAALRRAMQKVVVMKTPHPAEVLGSNKRSEIVDLDARLRLAKCLELMEQGVTVFYPQTCVIDSDVEIGADTVIEPFVQLRGKTKIGSDCRIRSYSVINNTEIGDGVVVLPGCVMDDSHIARDAPVGPSSR